MNKLTLAFAVTTALACAIPAAPALATFETVEAKTAASDAAALARLHMEDEFGDATLKPGQYRWKDSVRASGPARLVISLADQRAYLYRGDALVAVSTVSTGTKKNPTPTGIFPILAKKTLHRSRKYDNAPMPFMQRLDDYGIALHAGVNPGYPASHGCIRLPAKFAAKLYGITEVGSEVLIGA